MNVKESDNDRYGTFLVGIGYSGIVVVFLLLISFVFVENIFLSYLEYFIIACVILSAIFFRSGLKKINPKNIGYLTKLGKPDFSAYYSGGLWWFWPFWELSQNPHMDISNVAEPIEFGVLTDDKIPVEIEVNYRWKLVDPLAIWKNYDDSRIKLVLETEFAAYARNSSAIDLLSDTDLPNKVISKYLEKAGSEIGISFSKVFVKIKYSDKYSELLEKYRNLRFEFDKVLMDKKIEAIDIQMFQDQILGLVNKAGCTKEEALNFIRSYKNQLNVNETINKNRYDFNINLEQILNYLMKLFGGG